MSSHVKRTPSDPYRRGSDSSSGSGLLFPPDNVPRKSVDVSPVTMSQVKSKYSVQFLKRGSESTVASGSTMDDSEENDTFNDLEGPKFILLGEVPSRKGSAGSRRRSASLPENM